MMRLALLTAVMVTLGAACGPSSPTYEHVQVASLRFDVPAEWKQADRQAPEPPTEPWKKVTWHRRGVVTAQWMPEANDRKESITVIRSARSAAVAGADASTLASLVATAQRSLANVHASAVIPIRTVHGLVGAQVEVDFVPPGQTGRYHRVHVVLAGDHATLIHILYTARDPQPDLATLNRVLETLTDEEG
jgi:hypothetical protein